MGELAALGASAVWACASILFLRLGKTATPVAMNFLKGWIAFLLMVPTAMLIVGPRMPTVSSETLGLLAASGLVGIAMGDSCYFYALARIGARRALLMSALAPPTTAILSYLYLGEALTPTMLAGMALTMVGVIWVIFERSESDERGQIVVGVAFAVAAVVCQSIGNVLTKAGSHELAAIEISVIRIFAGSIGLAVGLGALRQLSSAKSVMTDRTKRKQIIVATIVGTYLGIWLLNTGLKYTESTGVAATLSSTSPIFILPLAAWFEKEKLTPRAIVGALIAVAGVAILFST